MHSIFVSHSSLDKPLARRLGNDFRAFGANVWIDEFEIKVGDSLIDKIFDGIQNADYVFALISKNSVTSKWVQKELHIALTREIGGKSIKVLPCRLDDCEMPIFLEDKKYANFSDENKYIAARQDLANAMDLKTPPEQEQFFNQFIYYDLDNLNDGFDSPQVKYFSQPDFQKALERIETFGGKVFGIEPWPDKQFAGVKVFEDYTTVPEDSRWYKKAFSEFVDNGITSYFSISGSFDPRIIKKFI